jgi:aryl-alcohol dehydrogenase-like predicted oxidoreductase
MHQRELGNEGLQVGAIGLGTGPMCVAGDRPSIEDATKVLTRAAEHGVTLWDTADAYSLDEGDFGYGERLVAQALRTLSAELRERVVIATKGGTVRPQGRWEQDGGPEYLRAAIDSSLRTLNVERIDLWQWHAPDTKVPFEDSIGAIAQAHQAGKIRLVGLSNVSAAQIETARQIVPISVIQNRYGFHHREPEEDGVLEKCRELGITFLPYSPLGGMSGASDLARNGVLSQIAAELGVSPQRVVLAWLLGKYEKMIPIPGVRRIETLEDSAGAADVVLSDEQQARLDAAK